MPDALKCDFAIENFNREILAWITLLSQKEKRYSTDWTLLETEITKKYDDPNRIYHAYVDWNTLKMQGNLDKYENKFDTLLAEMPTANVPTGQVQVFHYIQGLTDDLKREVMTHFVKNKETYELSAAKMHARVIFEMPNATPSSLCTILLWTTLSTLMLLTLLTALF
jgi:hypothetical protein